MLDEINAIFSKFENNWEPSPKGQQEWTQSFFFKVTMKDLYLTGQIKKLKEFFKTDLSEESFKDIFSNNIISLPKFISPLVFHKQLKDVEIKKIAFNLSNLTGLDYQKAFMLCSRMYRLYKLEQWNYQTFMVLLNDYDPRLKLKLVLQEKQAS